MRALLASPLGLLVGFSLGALGSGGSILAVPALVYGAGETPQQATTVSLVVVATAALTGLSTHYRAGRVRTTTGILFGLSGIGGSFAGTALNRRLDPNVLLLGFSVLIVIAAWRMLTACPSCTRVGEARELAHTRSTATPRIDAGRGVLMLLAGTVVGFLTGLFGVGGGFVIVPMLTLILEFSIPEAIGTSLVVVAINSVMALVARVGTAHVDWGVAIAFTVAAVLGSFVGGRVADRLEPEGTLRLFAGGLIVLALYTAGNALVGLGRA